MPLRTHVQCLTQNQLVCACEYTDKLGLPAKERAIVMELVNNAQAEDNRPAEVPVTVANVDHLTVRQVSIFFACSKGLH